MEVSIIIRTYNEGRRLGALLDGIRAQRFPGGGIETIVMDSGSTDGTLAIARNHDCRILHIAREEFTFGRSLNRGCQAARGRFLVFVSGHCVPADDRWLEHLVYPLQSHTADYTYGRQMGNGQSRFSENQLFKQYFPAASSIHQEGFFCNNANAALRHAVWERYRFNEELTGLEDMELGKRIAADGLKIAYIASAAVYHLHDESWSQVRNRYEREAVALQRIMPEVHISLADFLRYFVAGVMLDLGASLQERRFLSTAPEIVMFRFMQYLGAYRGNHEHRKLSKEHKERYFYPRRAMPRDPLEPAIDRTVLRDDG